MLLGEVPVALESIEKALELDQTDPDAWLLHARLLSAGEGRTSEAIQSVRRAVALGEYGILLEAEILENDGRLDAAREVLENHLKNDPGDPEARGRLALILLRAGSPDWARDVLNQASELSWESAALHVMDGRLHLETAEEHLGSTGTHDEMTLLQALTAFDEAIERDRESGLAWLGRSRTLRYQALWDESEVALIRARRLIPDHPSIPLEEARLCLELGRYDQANTMLAEAATRLHNHHSIAFVRGLIAARQGRLSEAQSMFTKVLDAEPKHSRARLNRCAAALLREDLSTALDDANELVETHPNFDLARQRRAEILMNLADWPEAAAELRRLSERNPTHTMALVHLGTCLIAMDRAEQAEIPLNKALKIDPEHSDAWYQRGLLYLDFGRIEEAQSDFQSAADCDEKHLDARLRLAAILHDGEDLGAVAAAWRDVLDIDPEHKLARRRLEETRDRVAAQAPRIGAQD
jgi:tetratricopeptide (TPR) repeat protein